MSDPTAIVNLLQAAGVLGALVLGLWMLSKRKLVFGWMYDAKVAECEEWKGMALRGTELAKRSVDTAASAIDPDERLSAIESTLREIAGRVTGQ